MIQLSGAGKRFGHKLLFENVDWLTAHRDRVARSIIRENHRVRPSRPR